MAWALGGYGSYAMNSFTFSYEFDLLLDNLLAVSDNNEDFPARNRIPSK